MRERAILYKAREYCISPSAHTQTRTSRHTGSLCGLSRGIVTMTPTLPTSSNTRYIYPEIAFYIRLKGYKNFSPSLCLCVSLAQKTQKRSQSCSQPMQPHKNLNTCARFECRQRVWNLCNCDMLTFTFIKYSDFTPLLSNEQRKFSLYIWNILICFKCQNMLKSKNEMHALYKYSLLENPAKTSLGWACSITIIICHT